MPATVRLTRTPTGYTAVDGRFVVTRCGGVARWAVTDTTGSNFRRVTGTWVTSVRSDRLDDIRAAIAFVLAREATEEETPMQIGDRVRIFAREIVNGRVIGRVEQRGDWEIAGTNRHGDWTIRHVPTGTTLDVPRVDVEPLG